MEEEGVEVSGKTVDEAIEQALDDLGLERHQVRIQILSAGRPGLLGLRGEDARVRVTPLAEGEESQVLELEAEEQVQVKDISAPEVELAADNLKQLLQMSGVEAEVTVREAETPGDGQGRASAVLDVAGDDLGLLIGRRGVTLGALQYLINVMINRQAGARIVVTVDVERYRRRREDALRNLAFRLADRVKQSGRPLTMEPMPAAERRIVHLALAGDPDVTTSSVGDGETRKVVISLRRRPPPPPPMPGSAGGTGFRPRSRF